MTAKSFQDLLKKDVNNDIEEYQKYLNKHVRNIKKFHKENQLLCLEDSCLAIIGAIRSIKALNNINSEILNYTWKNKEKLRKKEKIK